MSHRICTECGLIWISGTAYDNAWHEGRMCPACLETTGAPFERIAMSIERLRAAAILPADAGGDRSRTASG